MTDVIDNGQLALGIDGFTYADLYEPVRLKELAERFYDEVEKEEPLLADALRKYIASGGQGLERRVESKILTDAAPHLSHFVARLFRITVERGELEQEITVQNPVWRYKFFVQRRAAKKFKPEQLAEMHEGKLWLAVTQLRNAAFDETLVRDEELSIASMAGGSDPNTAPSVQVMALTTMPMRSARPGNVPSSHRRHTSTRAGAGPVRSGIRTGAAISARGRCTRRSHARCRRAHAVCARK